MPLKLPRTIYFLLVIVSLFSCGGVTSKEISNENEIVPTEFASVVEEYGKLKVLGNKIVDKNGNPIQLRGMSLFWSQWIGKYYNRETVKWLKDDWRCTVVRAAMAVDQGGYLTNPEEEKAKVMAVVDAAIAEGIYVIIDWHDHHGEDHLEEAKIFFAEMAQKYASYPNVIFETYNEPLDVSWVDILKPYHEAVIAEIRKYAPDNLIICGTRNWSQNVDDVIGQKLDDKNVAYTLHYYAATHKEDLRNIALLALQNDIALFVTEYGTTEASGNGRIDVNESKRWWAFLDEHKISSCNWSVADKEELSAALKPRASTSGNWLDEHVTASGKLVREEIRSQNKEY
jgi:endoglucanase